MALVLNRMEDDRSVILFLYYIASERRLLSSGDLLLRSIPSTALRLWDPPSNVPEGGYGPRRRQPPAPAALHITVLIS